MVVTARAPNVLPRLRWGGVLVATGSNATAFFALALGAALLVTVGLWIAASQYATWAAGTFMPTAAILLGAAQTVNAVGEDLKRQATLEQDLSLSIDVSGISWTAAGAGGSLRWDQIGYVTVGSKRRLWIGGAQASGRPDSSRPYWWSYLRRIYRTDTFALDVGLRRLSHSPGEILAAVREASHGRI